MSKSVSNIRADARPAGVIDTLQAGFDLLNRNAWLLILPIAIELLIWLGPQLSVGQLVERLLVDAVPPPGPQSGLALAMEDARRSSADLVRQGDALGPSNLVSLVSLPYLLLVVPPFFNRPPGEGPVAYLPSLGLVTAVVGALFVLGTALATVLYGGLGQAAREGRTSRALLGDSGRLWGWLTIWFVLSMSAVLAILLPSEAMVAAATTAAPAAGVVASVLLGFALWIAIYLFFTAPAIVVDRGGPLRAMQRSAVVVRNYFWSSLGLIVLLIVINRGLAIIWERLATLPMLTPDLAVPLHPVGIAVAIVGHSYITIGLAAAAIAYYKERSEFVRVKLAAMSTNRNRQ